ncbi:hypothetical protein [Mesorhizobium ventifaucium]|uniref:Uncharacterized protein n=1 Tax=Mesorhizobium ventifaucium TaxID=666020 RepID=A0ABM9DGH2_9HYPH|nr:hypothetical protein [Mesorhizobium ventifaucium]CAH2395675.1 hypothetical protein MES4922_130092 [Mesorhizobium ventifaucium]
MMAGEKAHLTKEKAMLRLFIRHWSYIPPLRKIGRILRYRS